MESSLDAGDPITARRLLDETDETLRGWEWHHFDAQFDRSIALIDAGEPLTDAAVTGDLRHVVTVAGSGRVLWWDATTGAEVASVEIEMPNAGPTAITRDGSAVFVVYGSERRDVSHWALETGAARLVNSWCLPSRGRDVVVSAARRVASLYGWPGPR